jgi:hypothetical protein
MKTQEIQITKFGDVVNLNAFIAVHPDRARAVFMTSRQTGLWQLDLMTEGHQWTVGHYIEGLEDRSVEHDVKIKLSWGGYVNEELDEKLHYTPYVLWLKYNHIHVALPHEYEARTIITAPQICGHGSPLLEPVYIWRDVAGRFHILECAGGLYDFETFKELEDWVNEQRCPEGHNKPLIHWLDWYVISDIVSSGEEWTAVVRRAVRGRFNPTPDDVIELAHRLL